MSVIWGCCSSKRSDSIVNKTIRTLHRGGFTGFLYLIVPHEEVADYIQAVRDSPVMCLINGSERGLVKQRKRLRDMWPPGQEIVFIDDDVTNIKIWNNGRLEPCLRLMELVDACFEFLAATDSLIWGVYPICNALFMNPRMAKGNCYVVGAFYGMINDPRLPEPEIDELEDYERQLSEQAAGRPPIRFNWIGVETRYFKNPGGMQQDRSPEKREAAVNNIEERYSAIVKAVRRKDGTPDVKFIGRPLYDDHRVVAGSGTAVPDVSGGLCTASTPEPVTHEFPSPDDPLLQLTHHTHHESEDHLLPESTGQNSVAGTSSAM